MKIFQISAGFLLFPVTYQVEAESRKRRAAPEAGPGSEAGLGLALRSIQGLVARLDCVEVSGSKSSIRRFVITEKAPTRAFSWLKAATTAFTFKTLLSHYAKQVLTPRSLNIKLGPRRNYHKGRPAIRHYANRTACPL